MRDPRRAYRVVDLFEDELCDYTGAPFAIAVNSCTNAILLALAWWQLRNPDVTHVTLPRRTYRGVAQSALNAGYQIEWEGDDEWQIEGRYTLEPTTVVDAARDFRPASYEPGKLVTHSFHSAKQMAVSRGGCVLTDDIEAYEWLRAARMDGRVPGEDRVVSPAWHCPLPPDTAARALDVLSRWVDECRVPSRLPWTVYPDISDSFVAGHVAARPGRVRQTRGKDGLGAAG